ncbi:MAG: group II intron reverse transcriptase/maturase [Desulfomonile tiedjei]|uniref:Group II intron reverse transcriptase/maturase n=1 Tax=Desulfomonile tiedjei TaxID=2358 RepID=A0A9D6V6Q6_9BACT|nr:group II intron reverse transcriptase/maturase [Desulfomonile tiedjei]
MKESHGEGPASHTGPESCVGRREAAGEALTGVHADQPLSSEIKSIGTLTQLSNAEGNIGHGAMRESCSSPAESKTLCMRGNSLHGNREVPSVPTADGAMGRSEKVNSRTSDMYADGKSDGPIVPEKLPNNDGANSSAEAVEGRGPTKGNTSQTAVARTQSRSPTSPGLGGVREAAKKDRNVRFTALLHHITVETLRDSFHALQRQAAPGVDGVTWRDYEEGLMDRLRDLHERIHRGSYRAQPSRRTYIPKPDGRMRPLGIAALEDKIVQHAVVVVLNAAYETDFLGFSYGFRPGRGPHDGLDALYVGLTKRRVNWVLDADIQGFFDTIDHGWLLKFIEHRIADRRILRLIRKWLKAGVSEDGTWSETMVGTPQGAVISPLLANVYLHYVLDLWAHQWRSRHARGDVVIVRYADDFVLGFQYQAEAERFLGDLRERLERFGLSLHPDKTRLIEFGPSAAPRRRRLGQGKPETFDFLGFTHMCSKTRHGKRFTVKRQTIAKRLRATLQAVKLRLRRQMHAGLGVVARWLRSVVQGYMNYHAVPGNIERMTTFRSEVIRLWFHALRRRGDRRRITWARFGPFANHWLPRARILHPHPCLRFYAIHPR